MPRYPKLKFYPAVYRIINHLPEISICNLIHLMHYPHPSVALPIPLSLPARFVTVSIS